MANLNNKIQKAYISVANEIAVEDPQTANHQQRLHIAYMLAKGGDTIDWFIRTDFDEQNYDDTTTKAVLIARLHILVNNLIALGF